ATSDAAVRLRSYTASIRQCVIADVLDGIDATGSGGLVQDCVLMGRGSGGDGLLLGPGLSTAVADSTDPRPTQISRFFYGVELRAGTKVDHVVSCRNSYGFIYSGLISDARVTYCTAAQNAYAGFQLNGAAPGEIYCSISTLNGLTGISWEPNSCQGSGA